MRKYLLLFSVLFFSLHTLIGQVYTIQSIPDPKNNGGGYVSDPDDLLSSATEARLNVMLQELEDSTTAQAAVVIVNSIGEQVPKDFASSLFNLWGIGQADKDNGFLLLVVMEQRRMEMETGYGTEIVLTDIQCKRIQETYMVPLFKEGKYEQGILDGMEQVCVTLKGHSVTSATDNSTNDGGPPTYLVVIFIFIWIAAIYYFPAQIFIFSKKKKEKTFTHLHKESGADDKLTIPLTTWLILYVIFPLIIFWHLNRTEDMVLFGALFYLWLIVCSIEKRIRVHAFIKKKNYSDPYKLYTIRKENHKRVGLLALLIPIPFLFYYIFYKLKQRTLRNVPRLCDKCNHQMKKLGEKADDAHLKEGQLLEEKVRSVDYDVWSCGHCNNHLVQSYLNFWSKYRNCVSCNFKTQYLYKKETLVEPTTSSTGTGLKTYLCKHCNHIQEVTYTIPRVKESSSDSGSGGGWGGGSSGGGGSGSSW